MVSSSHSSIAIYIYICGWTQIKWQVIDSVTLEILFTCLLFFYLCMYYLITMILRPFNTIPPTPYNREFNMYYISLESTRSKFKSLLASTLLSNNPDTAAKIYFYDLLLITISPVKGSCK